MSTEFQKTVRKIETYNNAEDQIVVDRAKGRAEQDRRGRRATAIGATLLTGLALVGGGALGESIMKAQDRVDRATSEQLAPLRESVAHQTEQNTMQATAIEQMNAADRVAAPQAANQVAREMGAQQPPQSAETQP